jgi:serine/threonine protein kinase
VGTVDFITNHCKSKVEILEDNDSTTNKNPTYLLKGMASKSRELSVSYLLKPKEMDDFIHASNEICPRILDSFYVYEKAISNNSLNIQMNDKISLVMVYETFGRDLYTTIKKFPHIFRFPDMKNFVYMQIFNLVATLHERGFVHRDLKPQNMLIDFNSFGVPILRLCDLGSVQRVGSKARSTPYITSRFYRAPELLCGSTSYGLSPAVDLWSLACLIAEIEWLVESYGWDQRVPLPVHEPGDAPRTSKYEHGANWDVIKAVPLQRGCGKCSSGDEEATAVSSGGGGARPSRQTVGLSNVQLFHGATSDAMQLLHILNVLGTPTIDDIEGMSPEAPTHLWLVVALVETVQALLKGDDSASPKVAAPGTNHADSYAMLRERRNIDEDAVPPLLGDLALFLASKHVPLPLAHLLSLLLRWDPRKRISARQALAHPTFSSFPAVSREARGAVLELRAKKQL